MSAELFLAAIELPAVGAPGRWRGAPLRDGRGNYRGPGRAAPGPTACRSQKTPRKSRHPPPRGWPQQAGTGEGGRESPAHAAPQPVPPTPLAPGSAAGQARLSPLTLFARGVLIQTSPPSPPHLTQVRLAAALTLRAEEERRLQRQLC